MAALCKAPIQTTAPVCYFGQKIHPVAYEIKDLDSLRHNITFTQEKKNQDIVFTCVRFNKWKFFLSKSAVKSLCMGDSLV